MTERSATSAAGHTVIVQSSVQPGSLEAMAEQAAAVGAVLFDASVSANHEARRSGRLSVLVGAGESEVGELAELLDPIGRTLYRGVLDGAAVAKLADDSVSSCIRLATQEAMEFARAYGMSEDRLIAAIKVSGANCSIVDQWHAVDQIADGSTMRMTQARLRSVLGAAQAKGLRMHLQEIVVDHTNSITSAR